MFSLIERESKSMPSFPGLADRSTKNEIVMPVQPVQIVEEKKEEAVTKPKGKVGRPKKVVTEEAPAKPTGKKALSLSGKVY